MANVEERGPCQEELSVVGLPKAATQKELSYERGGFECELVQPPPAALLQTECSICLQILREPHLISCCGHSFCRRCIERIEKGGKVCPLCNSGDFSLMHNKGLERSLKELEVRCKYSTSGCEWTGKLGSYERHLNTEPDAEHQLEGCGFVAIACVHSCGELIQRRLLASHQGDKCPKRPYSCDYCREYESVFDDVTNNHWPECRCYPLSCPNHCKPYAIERQNLEQHLNIDCPLTVVTCDFHYAGCEVQLPRKDMPAHLQENFCHLSLLATINQKLAQENQTLTKKLLERNKHMTALEEASTLMRQEINQLRETTSTAKSEVEEILKQQDQVQSMLRKEIDQLKAKDEAASIKELKCNQDESQITVDRLSHEVAELTKKQERDKKVIQDLHNHAGIVPVEITMLNFTEHKEHNRSYSSLPFYSHPQGYKLWLRVDANGRRHVSVGIGLMKGEYDEYLEWPFQGSFSVQLLNHIEDKGHHEMVIPFTDKTPADTCGRVTSTEKPRSECVWGSDRFIAHHELSYKQATNCQYLRHDSLHFRVTRVE